MKIGIIGAGFVGRSIAKLALQAGHDVMLSNSRGPQTLFSLRPMIGCQVGSADEAAEFGEVVVIAVPLGAINALPVAGIKNKHVIDAVNYYPQRDGDIAELDSGQTTTSELLARNLPTARITKAFNAIPMTQLESDGLAAGAENRRALPLAGDDEEGKAIAAALYDAFGFDALDVGPLSEGWRFERGTPAYCVPMSRLALAATLAQTPRG
ncbi:NADPH-dependent F420 reductase [Raoultella terrigena]|jgi:predicted dinucleotide-binding enzyme|uniref:NADPH-dependent F420 reductase n=1 Tax=Raoultella terrigena TaxID=577 RepID=UPI0009776C75|nr:NAD(P)-binding domain-containing protein [Raoultella terrigena]OMP92498.1 NADP oxidoreductase [Raoultella terrigena]